MRLNAYHAITSASYLSLTSDDPILRAFQLYDELKDWSVREPEFKDDYIRFANSCVKYVVALVGQCRTSEEVGDGSFFTQTFVVDCTEYEK